MDEDPLSTRYGSRLGTFLSKQTMSACGRGCAPHYDYRCCCEPNCPIKNTIEEFNNCYMAVDVVAYAIENVAYEEFPDVLRKYDTLTRSQFVNIVEPILRGWFSIRPERVQDVIQLLLNDK